MIALIVNREGFPFSNETFDGNRADVTTMETILRMVERKYGKARRIWVFDRGVVGEGNLASAAVGQRRDEHAAAVGEEGTRAVVHFAERRHCAADH